MGQRNILISVRPKWCELIASGKKTAEIRKTKPSIKPPFLCYIYQAKQKNGDWSSNNGRVIGEFVCDAIYELAPLNHYPGPDNAAEVDSCLTREEIVSYCKGKGYAWHISDVKIYEKSIPLASFTMVCDSCILRKCSQPEDKENCSLRKVWKAPQSWYYVESLKSHKFG